MEKQKILVADSSEEFREGLVRMLAGSYEVQSCRDGLAACELLDGFRPDVMVLSLALPELDGLGVLKAVAAGLHRPKILVTTRFVSAYVEAAVQEQGVDYVMLKPCDLGAVVDRIGDLIGKNPHGTPKAVGPEQAVSNMLLALDVSTRHDGFRYLQTAVLRYARDPMQSVTKSLYPDVAREHDSNPQSVERGIRTAIGSAWSRRNESAWRRYFPAGRDGIVPRPTNTEFISHLAERIRMDAANVG